MQLVWEAQGGPDRRLDNEVEQKGAMNRHQRPAVFVKACFGIGTVSVPAHRQDLELFEQNGRAAILGNSWHCPQLDSKFKFQIRQGQNFPLQLAWSPAKISTTPDISFQPGKELTLTACMLPSSLSVSKLVTSAQMKPLHAAQALPSRWVCWQVCS